jgi:hypothetical protein
MFVPRSLHALGRAAFLIPALALAVGASAQPLPAQWPAAIPAVPWQAVPLWPQAMPPMAPPVTYPMPFGVVGWPAPVPMPMAPGPASGGWLPVVLVWMPVQALAPSGVDYGPVADTPVVELPAPDDAVASEAPPASSPEPVPAPAGEAGGGHPPAAPDRGDTGSPAAAVASTAVASGAGAARPAAPPGEPLQAASAGGLAAPAAVTKPGVDYGPIAPTPVVHLVKPRKPAATRPAGAKPAAASPAPPPKRRLCWTNGVVAPCR